MQRYRIATCGTVNYEFRLAGSESHVDHSSKVDENLCRSKELWTWIHVVMEAFHPASQECVSGFEHSANELMSCQVLCIAENIALFECLCKTHRRLEAVRACKSNHERFTVAVSMAVFTVFSVSRRRKTERTCKQGCS